ncbi:hypothetical protein MIR68_001705 [Amoeboaphelidium protococcarum]|nr:hypothetical protein MIR68_001705 [Amoeboaphelidium protococcarum]
MGKRFTAQEIVLLQRLAEKFRGNWRRITREFNQQIGVSQRAPNSLYMKYSSMQQNDQDRQNGCWTNDETNLLEILVNEIYHDHYRNLDQKRQIRIDWSDIATLLGSQRTAIQVRNKYMKLLDKSQCHDARSDGWTVDEDYRLYMAYQQNGAQWRRVSQVVLSRSPDQYYKDICKQDSESDAKICVLTLNSPKRGNALNPVMIKELLAALDFIKQNRRTLFIRCLFLQGEGKYFCTGMDLGKVGGDASGDSDYVNDFNVQDAFVNVLNNLSQLPIPAISILNGPALGGGVGLFFSTDIQIGVFDPKNQAYVCLAEVKRGLIPALISPTIVRRFKAHSVEVMLGGKISCIQLYDRGYLSALVSNTGDNHHQFPCLSNIDGQPSSENFQSIEQAIQFYSRLCVDAAPSAVESIKKLVNRFDVYPSLQQTEIVELLKSEFDKMVNSEEAGIGIGAFMQKQKPIWDTKSRL